MSISKETQPPKDPEIAEETPPNINNNSNRTTVAAATHIAGMTIKAINTYVDRVLNKLKAEKVQTLTLTGDAGVGKTWMAKQVSESALKKWKDFFYGTVWISVDQMHDVTSFWESVARQLSLLTSADEWEVYVDDKKDEDDSEGERKMDKESVEGLRKLIKEKHEEKVTANKHLLLVLDGGNLDRDICSSLDTVFEKHCKKLVTRRGSQGITEGEIIVVTPLSGSEALELFNTLGQKLLIEKKSLGKKFSTPASGFVPLLEAIENQNKDLFADIVRILGATSGSVGLLKAIEDQNKDLFARIVRILEKQNKVLFADIVRILEATSGSVGLPAAIEKQNKVLFADIMRILGATSGSMGLDVASEMGIMRIFGAVYYCIAELVGLRAAVEKQNKVLPADIVRILGALYCIAELGVPKSEEDGIHKSEDLRCIAELGVSKSEEDLEDGVPKSEEDSEDGVPKFKYALTEAAKGLTEFVGGQLAGKDDKVLKLEAAINAAPNGLTKLLQIEREVLEAKGMIDYYWHIHDFFGKHGGVHYNELIVHWMLEGYINPVDYSRKAYEKGRHVLMAYEKGHNVLMKFVDYGLLRLQGDNNIVLQGPKLDLNDERLRGYLWKTNLRLPVALENDNGKGLGRIAAADGLIKTLRAGKEEKLVATLLVDGSHLCRELPKAFFKARPDVRVLGIFDSTIKCVPLKEGEMEKLFVLVLRSCHLLKDFGPVKKLKELTALEISGATFLKEIPSELFDDMPQLRSLNLSELGIESLPNMSKLTKLQRLILRRCSHLRALPSIRELKDLVVLNLFECSSLEKMADGSLGHLQELQIIDFSGVKLPKLPIIHPLKKLKQLLLEGCDTLISLRLLKQLTSLQILHLTGVSRVKEVQEDWFKAVVELRVLKLNGCTQIGRLPSTSTLTRLEYLDLSNASSLKDFEDKDFNHLKNLQDLNLSNTAVEKLPPINGLCGLQHLSLKGCSLLERLPSTSTLKRLESLDVSNASSLKDFEDKCFDHLENLQYLNLSNTAVEKLPPINGLRKLEHLSLEGCSLLESLSEMKDLSGLKEFKLSGCKKLKELPPLTDLRSLEDLDLSSCEALSKIPDDSFNHMNRLKKLNLAGCKVLKKLPTLAGLQSLKNLDLSDCEALSEIQDKSFDDMIQLQELNLSETQIDCLPSLGNPSKPSNLCSLVLRSCKNLKGLPNLNSLPQLKELDLFGAANVGEIKAESLNRLTQLTSLGLNNIKPEGFSSIAILTNLTKLSVNGCSGIGSESWKALTGLEVLELSGEIEELQLLDRLSKLRELSLRGCSKLDKLPSLENLIHLEVLDLSGTKITKLPDEISEMAHLKRLHLPNLKLVHDFAGETVVRRLPGDLDWDECSNSETSLVGAGEAKSSVLVDGTRFVKRLKDRNLLNNTSELFKHIIFYVHPSGKQVKKEDYYLQKYSDVYFKIREFPPPGQVGQCLEIHGFDNYPTDVEDVLGQAEYVSLVENKFLNSISDLHPENFNSMKGCWVDSCKEMKSIYKEAYIDSKSDRNLEFAENLEMLRISNLTNLRSFYEGNVQCFKNLKDLNIDYCPMLGTVFSSKQLLENLETLRINFCGNLKTVFGQSEPSQGTEKNVQIVSARKLKHLHICHCHRLETIYPSSLLPEKLEKVKIKFCDKLQSVFGNKEFSHSELLEVQELLLLELPVLKSAGFKLQNGESHKVINCPKLQELQESNIPKSTNAPGEITEAGAS